MTLCLAGVCERGDAIVAVFDKQGTVTDTDGSIALTIDTLRKGLRVNKRWLLFFAGDDIRHVDDVIDDIKNRILQKPGVARATATEAVIRSIRRVIRRQEIGGHGAEAQQVFDQCVFMLAGFGARPGVAYLSVVGGDYSVTSRDTVGYVAIGAQNIAAEIIIKRHGKLRDMSAERAVYALCSAKFACEGPYIGSGTNIVVFRSNGKVWNMDPGACNVRG